jgi:thiopurine S-methyltransferase
MDPQFWLEKWQGQEIGFHLDRAHPLLLRHWPSISMGVAEDCPVLVPLCGKSLDLVHLRRLGHPVIGVELSPLAVEQFFAEQGLRPEVEARGGMTAWEAEGIRLFQGDFFALERELLPEIGAVYDRAALIALPPKRQPDYAGRLLALVPPTAPLLLIALEYPAGDMQGPPFSTPAEQVERLFGQHRRIRRLEARDALDENPGLKTRGLSALTEVAWELAAL